MTTIIKMEGEILKSSCSDMAQMHHTACSRSVSGLTVLNITLQMTNEERESGSDPKIEHMEDCDTPNRQL